MYLDGLDVYMLIGQQAWQGKIKWPLGTELLGNPTLLHSSESSSLRKIGNLPSLLLASRSPGSVFPEEMGNPEAGKPNQNICKKYSGFFWLPSHRTLRISNCSKLVSQEPAREQGKGARSLVLSRRVPGGLPRNREIREVSEQTARGWGKCLSETCQNVFCRMFSFWHINSLGTKKISNRNFPSLLSLILPSIPLSWVPGICLL